MRMISIFFTPISLFLIFSPFSLLSFPFHSSFLPFFTLLFPFFSSLPLLPRNPFLGNWGQWPEYVSLPALNISPVSTMDDFLGTVLAPPGSIVTEDQSIQAFQPQQQQPTPQQQIQQPTTQQQQTVPSGWF